MPTPTPFPVASPAPTVVASPLASPVAEPSVLASPLASPVAEPSVLASPLASPVAEPSVLASPVADPSALASPLASPVADPSVLASPGATPLADPSVLASPGASPLASPLAGAPLPSSESELVTWMVLAAIVLVGLVLAQALTALVWTFMRENAPLAARIGWLGAIVSALAAVTWYWYPYFYFYGLENPAAPQSFLIGEGVALLVVLIIFILTYRRRPA